MASKAQETSDLPVPAPLTVPRRDAEAAPQRPSSSPPLPTGLPSGAQCLGSAPQEGRQQGPGIGPLRASSHPVGWGQEPLKGAQGGGTMSPGEGSVHASCSGAGAGQGQKGTGPGMWRGAEAKRSEEGGTGGGKTPVTTLRAHDAPKHVTPVGHRAWLLL